MGTLRIKRGTKTALQTNPGYTPAEGELVYTTDTKEVFVGDGATTGGTPVSVSTQNLEDLGNVQALAAQNDQILVYNGSQWAATDNPAVDVRGNIYADDSTLLVDAINGKIVGPVETSSVTATNLVGNLTGDVVGSVTGNVVGNTTGTHFGNVTGNLLGDMLGSVFSDDSSVMIDSVGKRVVANIESPSIVTTKEITVTTGGDNSALLATGIAGAGSTGPKLIVRSSNGSTAAPTVVVGDTTGDGLMDLHGMGYDGTDYKLAGMIRVAVDLDQTVSANTVPGRINLITANSSGNLVNLLTFNSAGKLGIGLPRPEEKLHVNGNAKVTGFVQFGSFTTTERNALTAANGMVIYNTSDNKFQGYENGAWVNLI
tara:strand:+ start:434 stop:1546 length:1113 start_codon:yes stop_codon:yes gene_type:complete